MRTDANAGGAAGGRNGRRTARCAAAWLLGAVAAGVVPAGCSQQRTLPAVMDAGDIAYERQRWTEAYENYQEYVDRSPGSWRARLALARSLMQLERYPEAAEQLRLVYAQRPGDLDVLDELCDALLAAGQREELYRLLRGRTTTGGTADDYLRLGWYAYRMGDMDEARTALLSAARIDGGRSLEPQLSLAQFYAAIGDEAEAVRRLRMAYYLDPANARVQELARSFGEVPGPTFGTPPAEAGAGAVPPTGRSPNP